VEPSPGAVYQRSVREPARPGARRLVVVELVRPGGHWSLDPFEVSDSAAHSTLRAPVVKTDSSLALRDINANPSRG